jgi:probable rRNA maturation factor
LVIVKHNSKAISAAALSRFATRAQSAVRLKGEVSILVTGNAEIRALNRRFRRKDKPTDVLSFPMGSGGDIAISADIAQLNATKLGHALSSEIKILILHGMLHLAGYNHETDEGQMAKKETKLRRELRLPASLIERSHPRGGKKKR